MELNKEKTEEDINSELDWSELDKPFTLARAEAILEDDCEPDYNNLAQQQSDADYESCAPTPYDM